MQTAAIGYRVADFLKQHPPFHCMEETDLLALVSRGRVKFNEADEFLCWQNSPYPAFIFVIQQGAVSVFEELHGREVLRDVRGPGDIIGIERFVASKDAGPRTSPYSARANGDVVVYALPAADLEPLLGKYAPAKRYVEACSAVGAAYHDAGRDDIHERLVLDLGAGTHPLCCGPDCTVPSAARLMMSAGAEVMAVVLEGRLQGTLAAQNIVAWAAGNGSGSDTAADLMDSAPPFVAPETTISDCVLTMSRADSAVAAVTSDGSSAGTFVRVIHAHDLQQAFGENPLSILREIVNAPDQAVLRQAHYRARAFLLKYLTAPSTVGWLSSFSERVNISVARRLIALAGDDNDSWCWCFQGAAGRCELMTWVEPGMVLICPDEADVAGGIRALARLRAGLADCGYQTEVSGHSSPMACASTGGWQERFSQWIHDPIGSGMHQGLPFFDLRPAWGDPKPWRELERSILKAIRAEPTFGKLVAVDCLSSLPPLTFFQDAVMEESGESNEVFELQLRALGPVVEVGRAFGIADQQALGGATCERLELTRSRLPAQDGIFRDAAETLRLLLYLQARTGLRLLNTGGEILPSQLSRFDRQALKSGFRAIHKLLDFTFQRLWTDVR